MGRTVSNRIDRLETAQRLSKTVKKRGVVNMKRLCNNSTRTICRSIKRVSPINLASNKRFIIHHYARAGVGCGKHEKRKNTYLDKYAHAG